MSFMIRKFGRGDDVQLSPNFHLKEFECKCGACPETLVSMVHVERLEQLRREIGRPIRITSGYRCKAHNANVGGALYSRHVLGLATDIDDTRIEADRLKRIFPGVILYRGFTHLDSRDARLFIDRRPTK